MEDGTATIGDMEMSNHYMSEKDYLREIATRRTSDVKTFERFIQDSMIALYARVDFDDLVSVSIKLWREYQEKIFQMKEDSEHAFYYSNDGMYERIEEFKKKWGIDPSDVD